MMKLQSKWFLMILFVGVIHSTKANEKFSVQITADIAKVTVKHQGKDVVIQRNQNSKNTIHPDYALTSRECPPFCIRPMKLAEGVETIAELEVLEYLKKLSAGDSSILVIDSRTPSWVKKGTIPGSINIPWTELSLSAGGNSLTIVDILTEKFGVKNQDDLFDYSNAKTLVMFCNGMWCGQSPKNIMTLLKLGYPAEKIKWYRGGMQDWHILGLTTI
ncbi:MAG: rhodanese-like domain-containing protein [Kangiellaceae bacterium]|jgi:rhodanese-related sulfurtransferase